MEEKLDFDMFKEAYENVVKDIRILNVKDNETEISRLEKEIAENEAKIQEWNKGEDEKQDREDFEEYMAPYNKEIRDAEQQIQTLEATKEENKELIEKNQEEQESKKAVLKNIRGNLEKQYEEKLDELKKEEEQLKEKLENDQEYNDKKSFVEIFKGRKEQQPLTTEEQVAYVEAIKKLRDMKVEKLKILNNKSSEIKEFEKQHDELFKYFDELDSHLDEELSPEELMKEAESTQKAEKSAPTQEAEEVAPVQEVEKVESAQEVEKFEEPLEFNPVDPEMVQTTRESIVTAPKQQINENEKITEIANQGQAIDEKINIEKIKITTKGIKLELSNGEERDADIVPEEDLVEFLTGELKEEYGYDEETIGKILESPTVDKNILYALCDSKDQFSAYLQGVGYGDNAVDLEKLVPEIEYNLKDRKNTTFKERYELYKQAKNTQETLEESANLGEKCKINVSFLDKVRINLRLFDRIMKMMEQEMEAYKISSSEIKKIGDGNSKENAPEKGNEPEEKNSKREEFIDGLKLDQESEHEPEYTVDEIIAELLNESDTKQDDAKRETYKVTVKPKTANGQEEHFENSQEEYFEKVQEEP